MAPISRCFHLYDHCYPGGVPGSPAARTAYRRAMRIIRKQGIVARAEQKALAAEPPITPDEQVMLLQRRKMLKRALAQLDDRCRKLLTALFLSSHDTSYRELARHLRLSENSLGPTRRRCLVKLRKIREDMDQF